MAEYDYPTNYRSAFIYKQKLEKHLYDIINKVIILKKNKISD